MRTRYSFLTAAVLFGYMAFSQGFTVVQSGPDLNVTRYGHAAVNLPNGNVLVIGGHTTGFYTTPTAEIYNPSTNDWTLYNITNPHDMLAMVKLSTGDFMFMGGCSSGYGVGQSTVTTIYNPTTNTFTNGPAMLTARTNSTAIRLQNGNVLVVGNWYNTGNAELFDVGLNQFVSVGTPPTERSYALLLPADDGTAFIVGGYTNYGGTAYSSVEKYDPITNSITAFSSEIIPSETGWTTMWSANMPLIEETRLSNGNYVFLVYKTVSSINYYRIAQFNPTTKEFSLLETNPPLPDYTGAASDYAHSISLMVDPVADYIYLNSVKTGVLHEERIYTINAVNGILSVPTGDIAFPYYVYTGSKAWVNGNIMYTGGTIDGSNFTVTNGVKILSPTNTFGQVENFLTNSNLKVYPNPAGDNGFTVELPNNYCTAIILYDLAGKAMQIADVHDNETIATIQRGNLLPGVYILEVKHRFGNNRTRIVLQ